MNVKNASVIESLLMAGKKFEAIHKYQEFTGLNVAQAKNYVEVMEKQLRSKEYRIQPPLSADIITKLVAKCGPVKEWGGHNKISIIKECRELTGMGLKEAKDTIEDIMLGRKDWPVVPLTTYREVKRLIEVEGSLTGLGTRVIMMAALQIIKDMNITIEEANNIAFAIKDGRMQEPEAPPKFRSIDEGWDS